MMRGRYFIPPMWLTMILTAFGIVGTRFVYSGLVDGAWKLGLLGVVLMVVAIVSLGTPLAYARLIKKVAKENQK